jgi:hypothetical protein
MGERITELIQRADGLDLARAKTPWPFKWTKMPLGALLTHMTTHDRRHLWQAEQVRNDPNFPMQDPFVGKWKLNVEKSEFDTNHWPKAGTMVVERDAEGYYLQKAEGISEKGEKVAERPMRFILDGKEHPVPEFPGLTYIASQPEPNTVTRGATRRRNRRGRQHDGYLGGWSVKDRDQFGLRHATSPV